MKRKIRQISAAAVALVLVIALAGCASSTETGSEGSNADRTASNTTANEAASNSGAEALRTLKLPGTDWVYVAQSQGWLKETFEDNGIAVEIVEGFLGNEAQLMARGDLHFAGRMLYPYLLYKAQGADIIAVQLTEHPTPEIGSIIVLADSPYQTFDDLKGAKIATWRAGCPYMFLSELAEERGWVEGEDWTYVNVPSGEYKTALLSGDIDAVSCHPDTDVSVMLLDGSAREIANPSPDSLYIQGGGSTVIFAPTDFAENYPVITQQVIDLAESTQKWMLENDVEASETVEGVTRVPAEISRHDWARKVGTWSGTQKNLDIAIQETQDTIVKWMVQSGDLEESAIDPDDLFAARYFE